jgi:hypothetical protein
VNEERRERGTTLPRGGADAENGRKKQEAKGSQVSKRNDSDCSQSHKKSIFRSLPLITLKPTTDKAVRVQWNTKMGSGKAKVKITLKNLREVEVG